MKKIMIFVAMIMTMVFAMVVNPKVASAQMTEVEFVNTIPSELAATITVSVDEDVDTAFMGTIEKFTTAIVDPVTLKGIGAGNSYIPDRGRWVLPESITTIYVLFEYGGKKFSNSFELQEGKTTIFLNASIVGLMRPGKSEFKSDMIVINNKSGFDIRLKVAESNMKFPLDGVLLSKDGSTYTKLPAEAGIYHFMIQSLQSGSPVNMTGSASSDFVVMTTKTVFITNTTTVITITDADVKSKTAEMEANSVKIVNNTGYPITLTMPVMKTTTVNDKPASVSEPTEIFLGPYSKTRAFYKVNLGSLIFHAELAYKNGTIPYELQTTIFEGQKVITIEGGTRSGLKVSATPQSSSAYTY